MKPSFEQELLVYLASVWLACRWRLMGHTLEEDWWLKADVGNDLPGCQDYAHEMKLLCKEVKESMVRS